MKTVNTIEQHLYMEDVCKRRELIFMESLWSQTVEIPKREALRGNLTVHTAVIGAGMSGLLTAYFLKKQGIDVAVLEADQIAGGQTKNTTAKITGQHGLFYERLINKAGKERAKSYVWAQKAAIKAYENIIKDENIECHFKILPSYLYTADETRILKLEKEAKAANMLGMEAKLAGKEETAELPFQIAGALCFPNQAQFHPLEFVKYISKNLPIYENTRVLSVKGHTLFTDKGNVIAENIVFATHYPFVNVPGFYFARQHQDRSYVLALAGQKELSGMYYSIDQYGYSLRSAGSVLLFGGGAHRTGKMMQSGMDCEKEGYFYIRKAADRYYPKSKEVAHWSAQDCMPHDDIPFIGKYSVFRPYWYVATGFKKWGMTSSMLAAMIISDAICGRENEYAKVFKPQRFLFRASVKIC